MLGYSHLPPPFCFILRHGRVFFAIWVLARLASRADSIDTMFSWFTAFFMEFSEEKWKIREHLVVILHRLRPLIRRRSHFWGHGSRYSRGYMIGEIIETLHPKLLLCVYCLSASVFVLIAYAQTSSPGLFGECLIPCRMTDTLLEGVLKFGLMSRVASSCCPAEDNIAHTIPLNR